MTDYENHDALGLAALVRRGEVTPGELLDAMLERQARDNPRLNAVVTPLHDAARAQIAAGLPDGPFCGVPFLVKELVASVKGCPTTFASRLYANNVPAADSEVVARMRRSGLVIAASGLDPAPTLPIPTPTVRTPLPQRAFLPIVARGGLGRCP